MEGKYEHIVHGFEPVFDADSKILILGSLPSVMSRKNNFYYGNNANRFWRVMAELFESELPMTIDQKKELMLSNRIALWDVIAECDIIGSSDASIRNVKPAQLLRITDSCDIKAVYANGAAAARIYNKYQRGITGMDITVLPSTSAANAAWNFERLTAAWRVIMQHLAIEN